MVEQWLSSNMLKGNPQAVENVMRELGTHALTLSHNRHLSIDKCKEIGLVIEDLEDDESFQDAVLTVHHAAIHTLGSTRAYKIIENHEGTAFINQIAAKLQQVQP